MKRTSLPTAALCLAAVTPAAHGTERAYSLSGGITFTAQHVDDDRVDAEGLASGDLFVTAPFLGGDWTLHFEGSVTPETGRVASVVGEANTDAGTVRSPGRRGNAQISEIRYERRLAGGRTLTLGMLETAAWFDSAATAIDENTQFMGLSFKHNLTIEFPDYALGAVYQHPLSADGAELRVGLSSSHGLADNPGASYAQALDITATTRGRSRSPRPCGRPEPGAANWAPGRIPRPITPSTAARARSTTTAPIWCWGANGTTMPSMCASAAPIRRSSRPKPLWR